MKNLWGIAFGVVCGFLGVGLLLLASSQPRGDVVRLAPPPTSEPMIVHVAGAVSETGVHSLPPGSRIKDAIQAAGGLAPNADINSINLAKLVEDGMQIWVPFQREEIPEEQSPGQTDSVSPEGRSKDLININNATQDELESLPGIGPVIAQAIIQYRGDFGPFTDIKNIQSVSGIGPVVFEGIRELITVSGP